MMQNDTTWYNSIPYEATGRSVYRMVEDDTIRDDTMRYITMPRQLTTTTSLRLQIDREAASQLAFACLEMVWDRSLIKWGASASFPGQVRSVAGRPNSLCTIVAVNCLSGLGSHLLYPYRRLGKRRWIRRK